MASGETRRRSSLSPFELKNRLVALAKHRGERLWLNAGRGNPNWLAIAPRAAFFRLGEFALGESAAVALAPDLGGLPRRCGIAARLESWLAARSEPGPGDDLLRRGVAFARDRLGIGPDALVGEWVDGVLGDHYPLPVRMLPHAEALVRAHLAEELFGGDAAAGAFDWFAVEGASAGITYALQTLAHSRLLRPGDAVAVGVPIFTPYLELPRLPEYRFEVVEVFQDEAAQWRYPAHEIDKLRDERIRAFVLVNPSNPTAATVDDATLDRIAAVARDRPELIVVTDDVYAPFVAGFRSVAAVAPRQTVVLYSFSKFWGTTGLRLGVVGVHSSNALDEPLRHMQGEDLAAACARYAPVSPSPGKLKLIDRMVADSRAIGLNHTAGLSTPQQVQIALIALDALLDEGQTRKRHARAIVRARFERLYAAAGLARPDDPRTTNYYATIDIPALARERHGDDFARWLVEHHEPIDFVVRLAEERGIVLLDGGGFDAPAMSVRVSLANLPDDAYAPIGRAIVELIGEYHARWLALRRPKR